MQHLDFIVWMCVFPLSITLCQVIEYRYGDRREYSDGVRGMAALIITVLWLGIGKAMW